MTAQKLYLSIDQGGSSSRALVINQRGQLLSSAQIQVATKRKGECVEQDADELRRSIVDCINACVAKLTIEQRTQLVSAGLVTQRSSVVAINKLTGAAITPILSWQDSRAAKQLAALRLDANWLSNITGLRASAHFGASKMAWCVRHLATVQQAAADGQLMFLPLAAYLVQALTKNSVYRVDPANASRTLLMDIRSLTWQPDLLAKFAINAEWLPEICHTQAEYGDIKLTIEQQTISLPLRYVNGDQSSALFADGAEHLATETAQAVAPIYLNLGTGAFVSRFLAHNSELVTHATLLTSLVYSDERQQLRVIEGSVNGAGAALAMMSEQLAVDVNSLHHVPSTQTIPIFINTVAGLAAPFWRTDLTSQFIGAERASAAAKLMAVLESIVFLIKAIIDAMADVNIASAQIRVSGGLSANHLLCQKIADLCQQTVVRSEHQEASALGAVWWLAGQPKTWLMNSQCQTFKPTSNPVLTQRWLLWCAAMRQLTEA